VIVNAGKDLAAAPSLTLIVMFAKVPAAVGMPWIRPVFEAKVAQAGRFVIENVSVSLFGSLAVGVNEYIVPTCAEVVGEPEIVGGEFEGGGGDGGGVGGGGSDVGGGGCVVVGGGCVVVGGGCVVVGGGCVVVGGGCVVGGGGSAPVTPGLFCSVATSSLPPHAAVNTARRIRIVSCGVRSAFAMRAP
jgi:hypothetical protein